MFRSRHPLLLPSIVVFVALPATLATAYYFATHDPTFRPLGISREDAERFDRPLADLEIVVTVDWGTDAKTDLTQDILEDRIGQLFHIYDVEHRMRWQQIEGKLILVTMQIDHVTVGPVKLSDLATAIPSTIASYRALE